MTAIARGLCAALLGAAAVAGCTDVSTDPQVPLSLQFDSLPALAIVVGDTMRGGDQLPARVSVTVFNSAGGTVSDTVIRLIGIDTLSVKSFRVIDGLRLVGTAENSTVRVVAQAGSLQSQTQTFAVVSRPTGLGIGDTTTDSIVYDAIDTTARYRDITATLFHQVGDSAATFQNGLRIAFRVASFSTAILDSVRIIAPSGTRPITSALISGGLATIRVKAYPKPRVTGTGSIVIEATARAFGAPVTGSPLSLPIKLVPFTLPP